MSSSDIVFRAVRNVPLLRGLTDNQVRAIAARAERVMFSAGDVLVQEGVQHTSTTVIVDGFVECISGIGANAESTVRLQSGTVLTEMAMVVEIEATSTVIAKTQVKAIRIHQRDMLEALESDPDVSERLIEEVSERLRETAADLRAIEQDWASPERELDDHLPGFSLPARDLGFGFTHAQH